ncbi:MAG: hypothetical protein KA436_12715 [Oligoflexales bacterium]|nr:hypothetical protein [Oligoflexales bacterium]
MNLRNRILYLFLLLISLLIFMTPPASLAKDVCLNHDCVSTHRMNYVFDLTGSVSGFGDVSAPLWTILKLKSLAPNNRYSVVIDERAEKIITTMYEERELAEISSNLGIRFYRLSEIEKIPTADVAFQLYFGGRRIPEAPDARPFINSAYSDDKTVTIVSDTMHGTSLDEVIGPDFNFFFKSPGIGKGRSGIIDNPDIQNFVKDSRNITRSVVDSFFPQSKIRKILFSTPTKYHWSFLYGAHNELMAPKLTGQSENFINALEKKYHRPIIVFSPNKKAQLEAVISDHQRIYSVDEFSNLENLKNKVYIVSIPNLSSRQFLGLMELADIPILIEGNSSICSAIRLHKEFLVYRSLWNTPMLRDIKEVDEQLAKTFLYSDVYNLDGEEQPYFEHYLNKTEGRRLFAKYDLSRSIEDFPSHLFKIIEFSLWVKNTNDKKVLETKLSVKLKAIHDEYFEYSVPWDLANRKKIDRSYLNRQRDLLEKQGIKWQQIENRLKTNVPNQSLKLTLLSHDQHILLRKNVIAEHNQRADEACISENGDRFFVVRPRYGLANRLKALAAASAVANQTKRKLVVVWQEEVGHMVANFNDLFQNHFPDIEDSGLSKACTLELMKSSTPGKGKHISRYVMEDLGKITPPFAESLEDQSDVIYFEGYHNLLSEDWGPKITDFYRTLSPTADVNNGAKVADESCFRKIGVHYRSFAGPVDYNAKKWNREAFIEALQKNIEKEVIESRKVKEANLCFLVISDQESSREIIKHSLADHFAKMGSRNVKFLDPDLPDADRDSVAGQQQGLAEWLMLSRMDYIIGTNGSSFSDEAARLTTFGKKIPLGPSAF